MRTYFLSLLALLMLPLTAWAQDSTVVRYDFSSLSDQSGTYTGTLEQGATLVGYGGQQVLDLGSDGGYFDFGTALGSFIGTLGTDYTISTTLFIPSATTTDANGNFVWCFSKSSTDGYLMLSAKDTRFAITETNYSGEQSVTSKTALPKGEWVTLTYMQSRGRGRIFVNNNATSEKISLNPDALGTTTGNWLGRSCYDGDALLQGARYADFVVANYAMTGNALVALRDRAARLNNYQDSLTTIAAMEGFTMPDMTALTEDVKLPTTYGDGIRVSWASSDIAVITDGGHITRPAHGQPVATATLTATLTKDNCRLAKTFDVGVMPEFSDEEAVSYDLAALQPDGNLNSLYENLTLPTVGAEGSVILWQSSDTAWLSNEGRVVQRPAEGEGYRHVVLTATLLKGSARATKTFDVRIHEQEPYQNYLFVYFPSNSDENLYYAISKNGFDYDPINGGKSFLLADTTTIMGGLRDPHILRGVDGWFYMVVTDMKSSLGWSSNRGIVMMRSKDLVHWTHSTVHFPDRFNGTDFAHVTRVWAPETIWDPDYENADGTRGRYMVYFSILGGPAEYDKDYYCYANDDFTDLLGEPTYLYDRGSATIDMDIVYNDADSLYHAFYKTEGEGGICEVTAHRLTAEPGQPLGSQWSAPTGTLQQTSEDVEGAGVFKLINSDKWVLMYDCYRNGHYQFCTSSDLYNFSFVQNTETKGAFTPRHGTVIPITAAETATLLQALPLDGTIAVLRGAGDIRVRQDYVHIGNSDAFIPVEQGTNLSAYDPLLYGDYGNTVSPTGPQDFTQGAVTYTVANGSSTRTYTVTVEADGNPVIPGFHADPEVLFSKKTGRFYVYPTTDGITGWGGYSFNVFSSPDLVHFTDEGTILNLHTDVAWASGNAWAPCIEEKFVDGKWRYYFYFSGQNTSLGKKTLGVAIAESPIGPFNAASRPLFTETSGGQMIDSDIFTDPVSGQTYFYYGNGQMHYRLMADDMMTVGEEYTITPQGGTLQDYAFREGTYVFYRNGVYYFLWSVDDTGSTNYHVAYGTSASPTGPITVAANPVILIGNQSKYIYGTGHNSIVNVPGTDDWYIVYHRINREHVSDEPGVHREVCVDKLTFNADGTIHPVTPTREGIAPVVIDGLEQKITAIRDVNAGSAEAVRVTYYTLDGVNLGAMQPSRRGLYIRQEVLSNGQVRALKILK